MTKLTIKQEKFVKEYLICMNATEAAKKAGYSEKTACKIGSENLHKPEIIKRLEVERQKTSRKLDITRESVLETLSRIQRDNETKNVQASLKSIEMMCKILGLNEPEKQDITTNGNNIGGEFKVTIVKPKED